MLAAAKRAKSPKLKLGYIRHASDEYRHTALIFKVLSNQIKSGVGNFKREYKFSPQNVILKGYVDKNGYLVEKLTLKKFVEFVYSNEYLAKESFDYLCKRIKDKESIKTINRIMDDELGHADDSHATLEDIMKDELVHHGMAKKFYEAKFPEEKLQKAFKRERLKNKIKRKMLHPRYALSMRRRQKRAQRKNRKRQKEKGRNRELENKRKRGRKKKKR